MYPLKFENIYYKKIWGGESWDAACHKNGTSIITNGELKGKSIFEAISIAGDKILGSEILRKNFRKEDFPLLVKIINSNDNLSVQVHPDNKYATLNEGDNGKLEAWYILSSDPGAHIILGLDNCDHDTFLKSCEDGTVEQYMNVIPVKPGELYLIEPGTLHSIGKGITLVEFQQNSDVTYRVYDYGRGRKLDLNKAMDVLNFNSKPVKVMGNINRIGFNVELLNINGTIINISDERKFSLLTVVAGEGKIRYIDAGKKKDMELTTLETILIPAMLGEYIIEGNLKIVKTFP